MGQVWLPVQRHWRLNERHYGALQGLDKKETTERHGAEQTKLWRRSYDVPPPPVDIDSPEHPINDPRYRLLPPDVLPATECLKDVVARVLPYWHDVVAPQLLAGQNVLVTAHGNSLRALVMHLEDVSADDIAELNIPTGAPRQYAFDHRHCELRRRSTSATPTRSLPQPRRSPRKPEADRRAEALSTSDRTLDVYTLPQWPAKSRTSTIFVRFRCSLRVRRRTSKRSPRPATKLSCPPAR